MLGEKVKELRAAKGLTAAQVGEEVGTTQANVTRIEKGYRKPSIDLLKRIADFFEVTIDELLAE